ncbi:hypothetical protein F5Y17DRAFT_422735, partial [Xylariaceae sp. FL0594]
MNNYKKPLVKLGVLLRLLFRLGTSMPVPLPLRLVVSSLLPSSAPETETEPLRIIELTLLAWATPPLPPSRAGVPNLTLPPPLTLPFSILRCFHPSSSLSRREVFSLSSRSSRSARRAASWLPLSLAWRSSIVCRSFPTLSRSLATSSFSCEACLSLRSICDCRSFTTRSTFRADRCDLERSSSLASSCVSSCGCCEMTLARRLVVSLRKREESGLFSGLGDGSDNSSLWPLLGLWLWLWPW